MVIFTRVTVNGTDFNDTESIVVRSTIGNLNSSSNFIITYRNDDGLHSDDFTIGDEVVVYSEEDVNPPTVKIITGIIEDVKFQGTPNNELLVIMGRDYTARLMDSTIPPTVFNNVEVSTIVTSLMASNVSDVTTTNVDVTPVTLNNIRFNHLNVYDAIKQLADLSGFFFYIDTDKDLHFELLESTSSGVTLDNTNVVRSTFKENDDTLYNEVYVYGDRLLTGFRDDFVADGGSVYALSYPAKNVEVLVEGSTTPKIGGVFDVLVQTDPGSPIQYLFDDENKSVVFVSGANAGDNIPVSGTDDIVVNYDRSTPIIKLARDPVSINTYGKKSHVIIDKTIIDPNLARDIAVNTVNRHANPALQGTLSLHGVVSLTAGNTILVNLPNEDVSNQTFKILEVLYDFNIQNNRANRVITVKVADKVADILDTIKQALLDIKKLQSQDALTTDILSRIEVSNASVGVKVKEWFVSTRTLGSSFVFGHPTYGDFGSGAVQAAPQTYFGDSRGPLTIQVSGGD